MRHGITGVIAPDMMTHVFTRIRLARIFFWCVRSNNQEHVDGDEGKAQNV